LLAASLGLAAGPARGDEPGQRQPVGMSLSARGMLFSRESPTADWKVVDEKGPLPAGALLVGLSGTELESKNGAVLLKMRIDFDSPMPILEPAVVLHSSTDFDLDFTLDRGRVEMINHKANGPARVRLHCWGQAWEATLEAPGASLTVEVLGRWRAGATFNPKPGPKDVPSADMLFLALAGEVDLKYGPTHYLLKAPPGPAEIGWNNFAGMDPSRRHLDRLPTWLSPPDSPAAKKRLEIREHLIKAAASRPLGEVMDEFLRSEDPDYRRVGVILTGAFDDLPRLGKALGEAKHADVWDHAVRVLRHWLGRAPGQDVKLYQALIDTRGYTPVQAETVIEFLHGFSEDARARPETYEMLIDYLADDKLAVRGLAYWHLIRLAPAGAGIAYDPLAAKAERAKARQEWKKLIPPGKLPPKPQEKR
jgi:hypothetical protein